MALQFHASSFKDRPCGSWRADIKVTIMENHFSGQNQESNFAQNWNNYNQMQNNQGKPNRPDNYLVWTILTTILCCLPAGIIGIIYSNRVNSLYEQGKFNEAQTASKVALYCSIGGAVLGIIGYFISMLLGFLFI